jgi:hypothetical protein
MAFVAPHVSLLAPEQVMLQYEVGRAFLVALGLYPEPQWHSTPYSTPASGLAVAPHSWAHVSLDIVFEVVIASSANSRSVFWKSTMQSLGADWTVHCYGDDEEFEW